jgi:hypothetical protein
MKYYYNDQIEEDEMGGPCSAHEKVRNAYKMLVRKPAEKRHSEDLDIR